MVKRYVARVLYHFCGEKKEKSELDKSASENENPKKLYL